MVLPQLPRRRVKVRIASWLSSVIGSEVISEEQLCPQVSRPCFTGTHLQRLGVSLGFTDSFVRLADIEPNSASRNASTARDKTADKHDICDLHHGFASQHSPHPVGPDPGERAARGREPGNAAVLMAEVLTHLLGKSVLHERRLVAGIPGIDARHRPQEFRGFPERGRPFHQIAWHEAEHLPAFSPCNA